MDYPDSLSTGLTSKRTSHKVAEQGRRNRINDALKEMQSLLPKDNQPQLGKEKGHSSDDSPADAAAGAEEMEKRKEAAVKSNSSKAATVESANVYIRQMHEQMAALIAENAAMKKKYGDSGAAGTPSSEGNAQKAVDSASPGSAETK